MKDNSKNKNAKSRKTVSKGVIIGIISAVVVIAVVVALLFNFNIIGSKNPHKVKEEGPLDIEYTFEINEEATIAMNFGDIKISAAEYEFFYRQSYSNLQNSSQLSFKEYVSKKLGDKFDESKDYYSDYYNDYARENPNTFDFNRPIDRQLTVTIDSETGREKTWAEYIREDAINTMLNYRAKFELANEMGLELTDDVRMQVYDHIEGLRTAVKQGGYPTLDEYLKILFGDSCDEEFFKNELIREYMAAKYEAEINDALMSEYSEDEIKGIYDADYKEYDFTDLYVYEVKGENAEKIAKKIASETSDVTTFTESISKNAGGDEDKQSFPAVPKYYIDGNYSEELGEWAFDRERKKNETAVFKTQNGYSVVLVSVPVYSKGECVSYREIVFNKTDANGVALQGEALAEVEKKAESVYEQWKDSEATRDTFAYYAISESQGNTASSGGLNSGVIGMEINDAVLREWLLSQERKSGDVEIVETDDAFRIVYFSKKYNDYWDYSIRATKAGEAASEKIESAKESAYAVSYDEELLLEEESSFIADISRIYLGIETK